jgi:hypothetical protein
MWLVTVVSQHPSENAKGRRNHPHIDDHIHIFTEARRQNAIQQAVQ